MNEIQTIAQLGGTVFTVVAFLYYLSRRDDLNKKTYEEFNRTIENHLHNSNLIIKESSVTNKKLAMRLQDLTGCIKGLTKK